MRFDVIGFGALNVDKYSHVNKIAKGGEESFILRMSEAPGGSAANTIVGLARLGAKTGFIGRVASDHEGELLIHDFTHEGVDAEGISIADQGHSGTVSAFIDEKGERALYVYPSVNDTIEFEDINLEYARQTMFLHLTSMDEKPFRVQKRLVEELPDVKVSFDPGEIYAHKGMTGIRALIKRSFVAMPSENELKMLTKQNFKDGAATLLKEGANLVAVKLGKKGCYVTDGTESHLIPPFKTKVVDTTGAGDAFCAGFLYGLIKKKDLYSCGQLGNFVASKCIAKIGARAGLPRASDIRRF
jgi:ribokinase